MPPAHPTLVTLATYNEIENLPRLVDEILAAVPQVDVLVIDDNSPDGTGHLVRSRSGRSSRGCMCLHRAGKLGLGTATIAGMRYAIEHGYRFVLNMDADFSHHPRHLPALLAGMDRADGSPAVDVMIGSRYVRGGAIEGWPLKRHLMSRGVNAVRPLAAGAAVPRIAAAPFAATGYRCWSKSTSTRFARAAIRFRKRSCGS